MKQRPSWIVEHLGDRPQPSREVATTDLADVTAGDLWVARSGDGSLQRIVLVLNAEGCHVEFALTTNEIDWASDRDIVIHPSESGAPYSLLVETPLTGRLLWAHLVQRVGLIDDSLLDDILDFIWEERPADLEIRRGAPVPRPTTGERLEFEQSEAADLRHLVDSMSSPVVAVDRSAVERPLTAHACIQQFTRLLQADTVACAGLQTPSFNVSVDQPSATEELFGCDVTQWRLRELFARKLLSSPQHVVVTGESQSLAVCSSQLVAARWLVMFGDDARDGPVATVDGRPLFVIDESHG